MATTQWARRCRMQNQFRHTNKTFDFFSFGTMCHICVHAKNQSKLGVVSRQKNQHRSFELPRFPVTVEGEYKYVLHPKHCGLILLTRINFFKETTMTANSIRRARRMRVSYSRDVQQQTASVSNIVVNLAAVVVDILQQQLQRAMTN